MQQLHQWLEAQPALKQVEPNKAITYLLRHWRGLTPFLRKAGAPLDNDVWERALKRAVRHRKNALFYRTLHGAEAGDLFMSLIHTCELVGANPSDYLAELQRHPTELIANKTGFPQPKISRRFRPATRTAENVARRTCTQQTLPMHRSQKHEPGIARVSQ